MIAVSTFPADRVQLFLKTIKTVDLGCACVHIGLKLATAFKFNDLSDFSQGRSVGFYWKIIKFVTID